MTARSCLILCLALALAGCGSGTKRETGGKAEGEILPASVSDAMLPYDTVRSQAPLAPKAEGGGAERKDAKGGEADETGAEASEPAAEPPAPGQANTADAE